MTEKDDGGPAYPHGIWAEGYGSLRDWFAGQALAGILAASGSAKAAAGVSATDVCAVAAYTLADAMLKARKGE